VEDSACVPDWSSVVDWSLDQEHGDLMQLVYYRKAAYNFRQMAYWEGGVGLVGVERVLEVRR
jgi:hypothetical protein